MIILSYWVISTMNQKKKNMLNFLNTYHLKNIFKQKACFKNRDRPTCIDLVLTNSSFFIHKYMNTLFASLWSVDTTFIFLKKLFINLLVAKIKSIVTLGILELSLGLSDIFPKSKVCAKTLQVLSNKL